MRDAARALHDLGPQWVLVKGGHLSGGDAVDVLFDGDEFHEFSAPRDTRAAHTHGSGDTLAAAITAGLARGLNRRRRGAAGQAVHHVRGRRISFPLGAGLGPVGHFWRVREPARRAVSVDCVATARTRRPRRPGPPPR